MSDCVVSFITGASTDIQAFLCQDVNYTHTIFWHGDDEEYLNCRFKQSTLGWILMQDLSGKAAFTDYILRKQLLLRRTQVLRRNQYHIIALHSQLALIVRLEILFYDLHLQ